MGWRRERSTFSWLWTESDRISFIAQIEQLRTTQHSNLIHFVLFCSFCPFDSCIKSAALLIPTGCSIDCQGGYAAATAATEVEIARSINARPTNERRRTDQDVVRGPPSLSWWCHVDALLVAYCFQEHNWVATSQDKIERITYNRALLNTNYVSLCVYTYINIHIYTYLSTYIFS